MIKALVTGGAGFIGSHLAEALCRQGARVVVLDNLSTGTLANLAWREPGGALEFVAGDLKNPALVREAVAGCDWVFHQAAQASVPLSVAQPAATHADNLEGSLQLLIAARDAGVRRFVFASSSAIYGDGEAAARREDHAPDPLSPYALQKYASERYAQLFWRLYGFETVSLRYFNVFGPRQAFDSAYSGVIARFCTSLLQEEPVTIFGDGRQSRDFVYVSNVVAANLLAAEQPAGRVAGRVFNIGGGQSIDLLQLLAELQRLTGIAQPPRFAPPRPGDPRHSQADIAAAVRDLGYSPGVSWQDGLARTLDFYRSSPAGVTCP